MKRRSGIDRYRSIAIWRDTSTPTAPASSSSSSTFRRRSSESVSFERIDEPEKNWKFSLADIEERKFWDDYMKAYEECLSATSTSDAPWYVVPADDKENARLIVSQIVLDTLEDLNMTYPKTSAERHQELLSIRKQLSS